METYRQWGQHLTRAETYETAAELFDRIDGSWEARTAVVAFGVAPLLGVMQRTSTRIRERREGGAAVAEAAQAA